MTAVELPVPPSVNGLWRSYRSHGKVRVVCSKQYTAWLGVAVPLLRLGLPRVVAHPAELALTVRTGKGWRKDRDLDNCLKAVADAVVRAGRLPDDSAEYVRRVSCELGGPHPTGQACVELVLTGADPMTL